MKRLLQMMALLLATSSAAVAQTSTPTPTPSRTPTPTPTATPVASPTPGPPTTVAAGFLHPTQNSQRVNGVRIRVQPDGSVWFLESSADIIAALKDGVMKQWQIRSNTSSDPLGANPVDFQIDGDIVWFIESGESTLPAGASAFAKLDTTTGELTEWVVTGSIPAAFYRAPDGTVWLPQTAAVLQNLNLETLQVVNYRSTLTYAYADMVLGPDGALWMADFGDNRIVRWVPGAQTETSWTFYPLTAGRLNPAQIQFDEKGFLWIAQLTASQVDRFDPATGLLASYTGINSPIHLDIYQGRVYVTSAQDQSSVSVIDPNIASPSVTQLLAPLTLDVNSTPSGRPAYLLNSVPRIITPTTFTSVPTAMAPDKVVVSKPNVGQGTLTTIFPSTNTFGLAVSGGRVWIGTDGQLAELNLQTIGGPGDQSVPVATSLAGPADSKIQIDVTLSNRGAAPVVGDALYLFSPGSYAPRAPFTIPVGQTRFLSDIFGNLGSTTQLLNGPVRLRTTSGDSSNLLSTVRSTRVLPNGGTFGYLFPTASAEGSLGDGSTATLFTGDLDTQISILGLYALDETSATVALATPGGAVRGTREFLLGKNAALEFNPAASAFSVDPEPGDVVRVAVTKGALQADVNVLDTGTFDVLPSLPVVPTTDGVIPNAGSVVGGGGKNFVSDLFLSNPNSGSSASVSVAYYPVGSTGPPQVATVDLAPLASQAIANFLPTLFGVASGQGALLIASSVPIASGVRIATQYSFGDYGTYAGALDGSAGITEGQSGTVIGLPQTATRRTNLLLFNRGTAGTVTVTGFAADGTQAGQITVELGDHEAGRVDSVFAAFGITNQPAGRIQIDVTQGMNVFAWAAAVDGFTGDIDITPPR